MSERLTDEQIDSYQRYYPHNGAYDNAVIQKLISDLRHYKQENASLLQVVEEQKQLIDRIHQQVQWGDQVQTNRKVSKWIEEQLGKD
jgi:hypothetical protein